MDNNAFNIEEHKYSKKLSEDLSSQHNDDDEFQLDNFGREAHSPKEIANYTKNNTYRANGDKVVTFDNNPLRSKDDQSTDERSTNDKTSDVDIARENSELSSLVITSQDDNTSHDDSKINELDALKKKKNSSKDEQINDTENYAYKKISLQAMGNISSSMSTAEKLMNEQFVDDSVSDIGSAWEDSELSALSKNEYQDNEKIVTATLYPLELKDDESIDEQSVDNKTSDVDIARENTELSSHAITWKDDNASQDDSKMGQLDILEKKKDSTKIEQTNNTENYPSNIINIKATNKTIALISTDKQPIHRRSVDDGISDVGSAWEDGELSSPDMIEYRDSDKIITANLNPFELKDNQSVDERSADDKTSDIHIAVENTEFSSHAITSKDENVSQDNSKINELNTLKKRKNGTKMEQIKKIENYSFNVSDIKATDKTIVLIPTEKQLILERFAGNHVSDNDSAREDSELSTSDMNNYQDGDKLVAADMNATELEIDLYIDERSVDDKTLDVNIARENTELSSHVITSQDDIASQDDSKMDVLDALTRKKDGSKDQLAGNIETYPYNISDTNVVNGIIPMIPKDERLIGEGSVAKEVSDVASIIDSELSFPDINKYQNGDNVVTANMAPLEPTDYQSTDERSADDKTSDIGIARENVELSSHAKVAQDDYTSSVDSKIEELDALKRERNGSKKEQTNDTVKYAHKIIDNQVIGNISPLIPTEEQPMKKRYMDDGISDVDSALEDSALSSSDSNEYQDGDKIVIADMNATKQDEPFIEERSVDDKTSNVDIARENTDISSHAITSQNDSASQDDSKMDELNVLKRKKIGSKEEQTGSTKNYPYNISHNKAAKNISSLIPTDKQPVHERFVADGTSGVMSAQENSELSFPDMNKYQNSDNVVTANMAPLEPTDDQYTDERSADDKTSDVDITRKNAELSSHVITSKNDITSSDDLKVNELDALKRKKNSSKEEQANNAENYAYKKISFQAMVNISSSMPTDEKVMNERFVDDAVSDIGSACEDSELSSPDKSDYQDNEKIVTATLYPLELKDDESIDQQSADDKTSDVDIARENTELSSHAITWKDDNTSQDDSKMDELNALKKKKDGSNEEQISNAENNRYNLSHNKAAQNISSFIPTDKRPIDERFVAGGVSDVKLAQKDSKLSSPSTNEFKIGDSIVTADKNPLESLNNQSLDKQATDDKTSDDNIARENSELSSHAIASINNAVYSQDDLAMKKFYVSEKEVNSKGPTDKRTINGGFIDDKSVSMKLPYDDGELSLPVTSNELEKEKLSVVSIASLKSPSDLIMKIESSLIEASGRTSTSPKNVMIISGDNDDLSQIRTNMETSQQERDTKTSDKNNCVKLSSESDNKPKVNNEINLSTESSIQSSPDELIFAQLSPLNESDKASSTSTSRSSGNNDDEEQSIEQADTSSFNEDKRPKIDEGEELPSNDEKENVKNKAKQQQVLKNKFPHNGDTNSDMETPFEIDELSSHQRIIINETSVDNQKSPAFSPETIKTLRQKINYEPQVQNTRVLDSVTASELTSVESDYAPSEDIGTPIPRNINLDNVFLNEEVSIKRQNFTDLETDDRSETSSNLSGASSNIAVSEENKAIRGKRENENSSENLVHNNTALKLTGVKFELAKTSMNEDKINSLSQNEEGTKESDGESNKSDTRSKKNTGDNSSTDVLLNDIAIKFRDAKQESAKTARKEEETSKSNTSDDGFNESNENSSKIGLVSSESNINENTLLHKPTNEVDLKSSNTKIVFENMSRKKGEKSISSNEDEESSDSNDESNKSDDESSESSEVSSETSISDDESSEYESGGTLSNVTEYVKNYRIPERAYSSTEKNSDERQNLSKTKLEIEQIHKSPKPKFDETESKAIINQKLQQIKLKNIAASKYKEKTGFFVGPVMQQLLDEAKKVEKTIKQLKQKNFKTPPDREVFMPYIFNDYKPYYDTQVLDAAIAQVKKGQPSYLVPIMRPGESLRNIDRSRMIVIKNKSNKQLSYLRPLLPGKYTESRCQAKYVSVKTAPAKSPQISPSYANQQTVSYAEFHKVRDWAWREKKFQSEKIDSSEYDRTMNDFYHYELNRMDRVSPLMRIRLRQVYEDYLSNTQGARDALKRCMDEVKAELKEIQLQNKRYKFRGRRPMHIKSEESLNDLVRKSHVIAKVIPQSPASLTTSSPKLVAPSKFQSSSIETSEKLPDVLGGKAQTSKISKNKKKDMAKYNRNSNIEDESSKKDSSKATKKFTVKKLTPLNNAVELSTGLTKQKTIDDLPLIKTKIIEKNKRPQANATFTSSKSLLFTELPPVDSSQSSLSELHKKDSGKKSTTERKKSQTLDKRDSNSHQNFMADRQHSSVKKSANKLGDTATVENSTNSTEVQIKIEEPHSIPSFSRSNTAPTANQSKLKVPPRSTSRKKSKISTRRAESIHKTKSPLLTKLEKLDNQNLPTHIAEIKKYSNITTEGSISSAEVSTVDVQSASHFDSTTSQLSEVVLKHISQALASQISMSDANLRNVNEKALISQTSNALPINDIQMSSQQSIAEKKLESSLLSTLSEEKSDVSVISMEIFSETLNKKESEAVTKGASDPSLKKVEYEESTSIAADVLRVSSAKVGNEELQSIVSESNAAAIDSKKSQSLTSEKSETSLAKSDVSLSVAFDDESKLSLAITHNEELLSIISNDSKTFSAKTDNYESRSIASFKLKKSQELIYNEMSPSVASERSKVSSEKGNDTNSFKLTNEKSTDKLSDNDKASDVDIARENTEISSRAIQSPEKNASQDNSKINELNVLERDEDGFKEPLIDEQSINERSLDYGVTDIESAQKDHELPSPVNYAYQDDEKSDIADFTPLGPKDDQSIDDRSVNDKTSDIDIARENTEISLHAITSKKDKVSLDDSKMGELDPMEREDNSKGPLIEKNISFVSTDEQQMKESSDDDSASDTESTRKGSVPSSPDKIEYQDTGEIVTATLNSLKLKDDQSIDEQSANDKTSDVDIARENTEISSHALNSKDGYVLPDDSNMDEPDILKTKKDGLKIEQTGSIENYPYNMNDNELISRISPLIPIDERSVDDEVSDFDSTQEDSELSSSDMEDYRDCNKIITVGVNPSKPPNDQPTQERSADDKISDVGIARENTEISSHTILSQDDRAYHDDSKINELEVLKKEEQTVNTENYPYNMNNIEAINKTSSLIPADEISVNDVVSDFDSTQENSELSSSDMEDYRDDDKIATISVKPSALVEDQLTEERSADDKISDVDIDQENTEISSHAITSQDNNVSQDVLKMDELDILKKEEDGLKVEQTSNTENYPYFMDDNEVTSEISPLILTERKSANDGVSHLDSAQEDNELSSSGMYKYKNDDKVVTVDVKSSKLTAEDQSIDDRLADGETSDVDVARENTKISTYARASQNDNASQDESKTDKSGTLEKKDSYNEALNDRIIPLIPTSEKPIYERSVESGVSDIESAEKGSEISSQDTKEYHDGHKIVIVDINPSRSTNDQSKDEISASDETSDDEIARENTEISSHVITSQDGHVLQDDSKMNELDVLNREGDSSKEEQKGNTKNFSYNMNDIEIADKVSPLIPIDERLIEERSVVDGVSDDESVRQDSELSSPDMNEYQSRDSIMTAGSNSVEQSIDEQSAIDQNSDVDIARENTELSSHVIPTHDDNTSHDDSMMETQSIWVDDQKSQSTLVAWNKNKKNFSSDQ